MRNLFWQISVTLDGFMEGPNHELDDTAGFKDEDFERYASEMLKSIGGMLIGRRTYELFAGYWPTAAGEDAERMNALPKIVFSRTPKEVEWKNSSLVRSKIAVGPLERRTAANLSSQATPCRLFKGPSSRLVEECNCPGSPRCCFDEFKRNSVPDVFEHWRPLMAFKKSTRRRLG